MEIYLKYSKDAKALLEALLWARDWATERRCTAPAQSRMQLLQQLLTLISCCCNKLRVLATRAARWLMWKIYCLEVFSHFQSPRIKHQVLFEVGIQLENPEMSSDLDFDRKVSIALQKYHEKRQRSTTAKRDKKNSEGQIWWNRNCWKSVPVSDIVLTMWR